MKDFELTGPNLYMLVQFTGWFGFQFSLHLVQFTSRFSLHLGPVYRMVWFTCWSGLRIGSVYMLVQFTGWFGLHVGSVYIFTKT